MQPNWMQNRHDDIPLSHLSIPGTHDSGTECLSTTGTVVDWLRNILKCQQHDIPTQLNMGIRYLDIRIATPGGEFFIVHDGPNTRLGSLDVCCFERHNNVPLTFGHVVASCIDFLDANPTETIIMCIKAADSANIAAIRAMLAQTIELNPARFYANAVIPLLGNVRGRIVLIHRFPPVPAVALGLDFSTWNAQAAHANAAGVFQLPNDAAPIGMIQDKFNMYHLYRWEDKVGEKINFINNSNALFTNMMAQPITPLCLNFASCTMFGYVRKLSLEINQSILNNPNHFHGCVIMDFPNQATINKIIDDNL